MHRARFKPANQELSPRPCGHRDRHTYHGCCYWKMGPTVGSTAA